MHSALFLFFVFLNLFNYNASIFLSGSLKGKIEALSKHTRQATGLTKQLLTAHWYKPFCRI
ncbi:MAG: hypothetical protein IJV35_00115 [Neisseriaceae bacterium]|nr:hypothetical protein [Neisseriaceae bacterium]